MRALLHRRRRHGSPRTGSRVSPGCGGARHAPRLPARSAAPCRRRGSRSRRRARHRGASRPEWPVRSPRPSGRRRRARRLRHRPGALRPCRVRDGTEADWRYPPAKRGRRRRHRRGCGRLRRLGGWRSRFPPPGAGDGSCCLFAADAILVTSTFRALNVDLTGSPRCLHAFLSGYGRATECYL